jgi:predicted TIM-barrel fold metal-dependent hydrolase
MAANYAKANPQRLLSCGSLHPRYSTNAMADIDEIFRLGLRLIKIHPPHQLFYPTTTSMV